MSNLRRSPSVGSSLVEGTDEEEAETVATTSPDDIPTLYEEQITTENSPGSYAETTASHTEKSQARTDYTSDTFTPRAHSQSHSSLRARSGAWANSQTAHSQSHSSIRTRSRQQVVPAEAGSAHLEDLQSWPTKLPPPVVSDRLGTSLTVKTHNIPDAQYTFEWVKMKLLKTPWKDADSSGIQDEAGMGYTASTLNTFPPQCIRSCRIYYN
eukprot:gb/GECG01002432.1/.p1 GENE.gb/GECG01002432.1/~~gb/GECG01002432.1/.p1  ORF type:complete len:211 (+),score=27.45 gb/GECG01002432.1/:1-633(+)